jgi:septum formation protein
MRRLTLGSQSPRRAELLRQLGVEFTVLPAHIDETPAPGEDPVAYVERMAREKAQAVRAAGATCVLAADTTVICAGESLGKPTGVDSARAMLERLSERDHDVCTALCLDRGGARSLVTVHTRVWFCRLGPATIDAYLATDEPWDKAGAYAIQGLAGAFVARIEGSYSNVVGLPLRETRELLATANIATGLDPQLDPQEGA